jgi:hypothetical protein
MVTQEELREHIGRKPFRAFRLTLATGEALDVTRTQQAVAMKRRLIVATPEDELRWIMLEQISRVEEINSDHP